MSESIELPVQEFGLNLHFLEHETKTYRAAVCQTPSNSVSDSF